MKQNIAALFLDVFWPWGALLLLAGYLVDRAFGILPSVSLVGFAFGSAIELIRIAAERKPSRVAAHNRAMAFLAGTSKRHALTGMGVILLLAFLYFGAANQGWEMALFGLALMLTIPWWLPEMRDRIGNS
jgi:hypothetical protein